jgi:hypothetical protein
MGEWKAVLETSDVAGRNPSDGADRGVVEDRADLAAAPTGAEVRVTFLNRSTLVRPRTLTLLSAVGCILIGPRLDEIGFASTTSSVFARGSMR